MKIEVFSRLEHNYTSAPIAQLAARLTFFIWFWPDQTWPERVGVQFSLEEHDFFSSFKLIFLSIFCMHLYHILINWSQKFWVVYVQYRFIYEQCEYSICNFLHWLSQLDWLHFEKLHKLWKLVDLLNLQFLRLTNLTRLTSLTRITSLTRSTRLTTLTTFKNSQYWENGF